MAVNIGPKIGIDGEKEYRKQINALITQQKTFSAEMRELESSFDDTTSAMEKNKKKGALLEKSIKNQEKQVEELEKGLKASKEKYGENATETQKWKQAVSNAKTELNKMNAELKKIPKTMTSVGQSMQNAGKKMQSVGTTMTKFVTAPLAGLGAASVAAFNEVDAGLDIVTKKTGATGEALASLQESARTMATTLPVSFETAGEAIGEVNTKFGVTGTDLENLTGKFIKFAEVNDTDVSSSVDGVQKVMAAFGLETKDADGLLDALTKTGQDTGISMDTLEGSMVKNAAALQSMGLDAYSAAGFLGQVETSGASTETVMSGLTKALTNANEEGKTLPDALGEFQEVMDSTASEQEKLNAAIDLFGKKAGPAIYQACSEGTLSFKDFAADSSEYLGTVEQTFNDVLSPTDEFQVTLNKVKDAGAEIGNALLEIAAPAIEGIGEVAAGAADWFKSLDEDQKTTVANIVTALAVSGPVLTAFGRLTDGIGTIVTKVGELDILPTALGAVSSPAFLGAAAVGLLAVAFNTMDQDAGYLNETLQGLIDDTNEVVGELDTATQTLQEHLDETDDNVEKINAQADAAGALVEELEQLESQASLTAVEQGRMRTIIGELNSMYPNLSLNIDTSTGKLNKSTKEIKTYVENARKMSLLEAYQNATKRGYEDLAEASINLNKARAQEKANLEVINALEEERDTLTNNLIASGSNYVDVEGNFVMTSDELEARMKTLNDEINKAKEETYGLTLETEKAQIAYDAAEETISDYEQAEDDLRTSMEDSSDATSDNTAATEENTASAEENAAATREKAAALAETVTAVLTNLGQEAAAWNDLYESTRDSIDKQIGLFDEWTEAQDVSKESILANIQSQIAGMSKYNTNMSKLSAAAAKSSNPNFKAIVKGLAEMGVDGAAYADALVDAMENDQESFNEILAGFETTEGLKDDMAATATYIKTDFMTSTGAALLDVVHAADALGKTKGFQNMKDTAKSAVGSVLGSLGQMIDGTKTAGEKTDQNLQAGYSNLPATAKASATKASNDSKTIIDGTHYAPTVKDVGVTEKATSNATSKIEKNVKPSVTISSISTDGNALQSAWNTIQGWFNRNPITSIIKKVTQTVKAEGNAEGGFIEHETLSWLAEGDQPEVVIPLTASKRSRALTLYEQAGEILGVDDVKASTIVTFPGGQGKSTAGSVKVGFDEERLYATVAAAAAAGMEHANVRIYWDNREAGRVMKDMGVQFIT